MKECQFHKIIQWISHLFLLTCNSQFKDYNLCHRHLHNSLICHNSITIHNVWVFRTDFQRFWNFLATTTQLLSSGEFRKLRYTLYLLKVHLQTFLYIPGTQKCQILSYDTLFVNEGHRVSRELIIWSSTLMPPLSCTLKVACLETVMKKKI